MCQLQRVIQQFFSTSAFSFNFHVHQFYFEGLSFLSLVLCATCCFRGCQRAPGFAICLHRQESRIIFPVHLNQLVSCDGFSPIQPLPTVLWQRPGMCLTARCNTWCARAPGKSIFPGRCISSSEQGQHQPGLCSLLLKLVTFQVPLLSCSNHIHALHSKVNLSFMSHQRCSA